MKPVEGLSIIIGPFVQIARGILFGIILFLMKDVFVGKKYGWLILWFIIIGLGIINTPGPAPFSIERFVYTQLPLKFHLKGAPEVLVQTLLFSYIIAKPEATKTLNNAFIENKQYLIPTILAGVIFSLSGIVLALILKIDVMTSIRDIGAFIVMFISMIIVYVINKWFYLTKNKFKLITTAIVYYIALAILPTVYNYVTHSPFKTFIALGINIVPVLILVGYNMSTNKRSN